MTDFLEIDDIDEADLPAHFNDGRTGDRVSLVEGGLLHVEDGFATVVPSGDVLAVLEHRGRAYLLVPRRPPAPPWIEVSPSMLDRGEGIKSFLQRLEDRSSSGRGYRDAVRKRRQNLSTKALREMIMARNAVPGALEVPSTIMLGVSYPWLGFTQAAIFLGAGALGYASMFALMLAAGVSGSRELQPFASLIGYPLFIGCIVLGGWVAITVGKKWKERVNKTLPRQRVLVLAPDGCIVGFEDGVKTLAWSDVGGFAIGPAMNGDGLVVTNTKNRVLGTVDAGWLDAPLSLVVGVAEAYRTAALDDN